MWQTFGAIQNSTIKRIIGACPTSTDFADLVNEALERLMNRGDWSRTVIPIFVCATAGCIVFPRYVGTVRKIKACNSRIHIDNNWYSFLEHDRDHNWCSGTCCSSCGGVNCHMTAKGMSPVFQDILGEGRQVQAYHEAAVDVGKSITIFGEDNNGQRLQTFNADGTVTEGIKLVFAVPFAATVGNVRRIDRVIKDVTQGNIRLYGWDTVGLVLEDVAYYEPSETNPEYVRYTLSTGSSCNSSCGSTTTPTTCPASQGIEALVKVRFIPVSIATDLVFINNNPALKTMIQSIRFAEAGDTANANKYEAMAIRELNRQLENDFPRDQIPVTFGELGGTRVGFQRCF